MFRKRKALLCLLAILACAGGAVFAHKPPPKEIPSDRRAEIKERIKAIESAAPAHPGGGPAPALDPDSQAERDSLLGELGVLTPP